MKAVSVQPLTAFFVAPEKQPILFLGSFWGTIFMRQPHYRKDRGAWYVRVGDGGKSQKRLHESKKEAFALWKKMDLLSSPESPDSTFQVIAEHFLKATEKTVAPKTLRGYGDFLVSACEQFGSIPVRELKPFHVTRWLAKKREPQIDAKGKPRGGWKRPDTQRGAIAAVKRCLKWAMDEGLIASNPLANIKKPRGARREGLVSDTDHAAMMMATDKGRNKNRRDAAFRPVLEALRLSGCRPGTICGMRVEDVDGDTWIVRQHKTADKTGKPLIIYLCPELHTLTKTLIDGRKAGPLFRNSLGGPWTPNAIQCRVRNLRNKLKLPPTTVAYAFRHTWATTAIANGTDLAAVAELLGHSDLKMLAQHYSHIGQKKDHLRRAAANAVAKPR
jgi:integrase